MYLTRSTARATSRSSRPRHRRGPLDAQLTAPRFRGNAVCGQHGSDCRGGGAGRCLVEAGGVIVRARPLAHLNAPGRRGAGEQFLEVGEAARAAAVLGRAGTLAGGACRVDRARVGFGVRLDEELVLPAVAEVVVVPDPVPGLHQVPEAADRVLAEAGELG